MNILITNDDGVRAPALPHLIRWARQLGDVTAIAPKVEQSGKSHAIDFMKEIEIKQVELAPGVTAYSVDSTPADCVRYGVTSLGKKFDLVISGINRGYNLGADIVYSGTIGAVFEACRLGIPGIALSANPGDESDAVAQLDAVLAFMNEHKLLEQHSLYNVNVPPTVNGIRVTRQGGIFFTDVFVHHGNDIYLQEGELVPGEGKDPEVDIDAIFNGYVSVTPLMTTLTNLPLFEKLKNLR